MLLCNIKNISHVLLILTKYEMVNFINVQYVGTMFKLYCGHYGNNVKEELVKSNLEVKNIRPSISFVI